MRPTGRGSSSPHDHDFLVALPDHVAVVVVNLMVLLVMARVIVEVDGLVVVAVVVEVVAVVSMMHLVVVVLAVLVVLAVPTDHVFPVAAVFNLVTEHIISVHKVCQILSLVIELCL